MLNKELLLSAKPARAFTHIIVPEFFVDVSYYGYVRGALGSLTPPTVEGAGVKQVAADDVEVQLTFDQWSVPTLYFGWPDKNVYLGERYRMGDSYWYGKNFPTFKELEGKEVPLWIATTPPPWGKPL